MKLIELTVKSFRCISENGVTVSFKNSDIIFLFGQNNSGKSTFLKAYEIFTNPKYKPNYTDFFNNNTDIPIVIEGVFQKEPEDTEEFNAKGLDKWVNLEGLVKIKIEWSRPAESGQKYTFEPTQEDYIKNGFGGLDQIYTHYAPTPILIPAMPSIDTLSKWVSDTIKTVVLKNFKTDEHKKYSDVLNEIENLKKSMLTEETLASMVDKANVNFGKIFPNLKLNVTSYDEQQFDLSKLFDKKFTLEAAEKGDFCIE
jgi:putative ATP-dependent endonuclease of the OLD family